MKSHAAVYTTPGTIALDTSCYGQCCYNNGNWILGCPGWRQHTIANREQHPQLTPEFVTMTTLTPILDIDVNNWVTAFYENKWYLAHVIRGPDEDGEYNITFTEPGREGQSTNRFQWPKHTDTLYFLPHSIMCKVQAPTNWLHRKEASYGDDRRRSERDTKFLCSEVIN